MGSTTSPCRPTGRCSRGAVVMVAALDMETPRKKLEKICVIFKYLYVNYASTITVHSRNVGHQEKAKFNY